MFWIHFISQIVMQMFTANINSIFHFFNLKWDSLKPLFFLKRNSQKPALPFSMDPWSPTVEKLAFILKKSNCIVLMGLSGLSSYYVKSTPQVWSSNLLVGGRWVWFSFGNEFISAGRLWWVWFSSCIPPTIPLKLDSTTSPSWTVGLL